MIQLKYHVVIFVSLITITASATQKTDSEVTFRTVYGYLNSNGTNPIELSSEDEYLGWFCAEGGSYCLYSDSARTIPLTGATGHIELVP